MVRRPFRRRRSRFLTQDTSRLTYTKSEPYALAYYLSVMFEDTDNFRIADKFSEAIMLFVEITNRLNLTDRLGKVLSAAVEGLVRRKLLHALPSDPETAATFDETDIPYCFEEDKKIEAPLRQFESVNEHIVSLLRILSTEEKNVFSSISALQTCAQ